jgi:succinylglutamate desuccinylase
MKKILFIACTHGDEQVGKWLWNNNPQGYNSFYQWQVIIGNPKAMKLGVRYTESDLNRSFNKKETTSYEEKRARELTPIIQKYDVLYDIHQTFIADHMNDCIFVNKLDTDTLKAIEPLSAQYVVLDDNPEYNGHFATSVAKVGITIEYTKSGNYKEETGRLKKDIDSILASKKKKNKKVFMRTYKAIPRDKKYNSLDLNNFKPLRPHEKKILEINEDGEFYPIFVNGYPDYYCFLNKKIDIKI